MDDKLLKPIPEVSYLTAGNAYRYRVILRFFYQQHERFKHFLFPEEIMAFLKQSPHFQDYTEDQLQQDLNQLVEWKNLIPRQDAGKVHSIEEFKKKRFRYQCTPYTVEIERMVERLEQLGDAFGGSLESTLFDRLLQDLLILTGSRDELEKMSAEDINSLWESFSDNFNKLEKNSTDYLAYLHSEKVEEIMQTEAFLAYKEALTGYLRNFMSALQRASFRIEGVLQDTSRDQVVYLAGRVADYQLLIPRLEGALTRSQWIEKYQAQWQDIRSWFLGTDGRESDLAYLQAVTNDTIRRIARYAQRLAEKRLNFKSRRKDYLYLAEWFLRQTDIGAAHLLSACTFGLFHTRHIFAESRDTEDIYREVWDSEPTVLVRNPRVRSYRERVRPRAIVSREQEKRALLREFLRQQEQEEKLINSLTKQGMIIIAELPVVSIHVRKLLLSWIEKCMLSPEGEVKSDSGHTLRLEQRSNDEITLSCEDGTLHLPDYVISFLDLEDSREQEDLRWNKQA